MHRIHTCIEICSQYNCSCCCICGAAAVGLWPARMPFTTFTKSHPEWLELATGWWERAGMLSGHITSPWDLVYVAPAGYAPPDIPPVYCMLLVVKIMLCIIYTCWLVQSRDTDRDLSSRWVSSCRLLASLPSSPLLISCVLNPFHRLDQSTIEWLTWYSVNRYV